MPGRPSLLLGFLYEVPCVSIPHNSSCLCDSAYPVIRAPGMVTLSSGLGCKRTRPELLNERAKAGLVTTKLNN